MPVVRENINFVIAEHMDTVVETAIDFSRRPKQKKRKSAPRKASQADTSIDGGGTMSMEKKKPNLHNAEFLRSAVKESDFPHDPSAADRVSRANPTWAKARSSTSC